MLGADGDADRAGAPRRRTPRQAVAGRRPRRGDRPAAVHLGLDRRAQGRAAPPRRARPRRRRPHRPLRPAADDVIYIPSPLAHQTGFLYGMWIALRLGATQVMQEALGRRARRSTRSQRHGRHVRAGGDAVPRRPRPGRRRARRTRRRAAADVRRHRRRDPAGARPRGPRPCSAPRSAAASGRPRAAWAPGFVPGRRRRARVDAATAARWPNVRLRIVDDDGRELPARHRGQLRDAHRHAVRRATSTARTDRRRRSPPTAGIAPATWRRSTPTATCGSPAASRTSSTAAARRCRSPRSSSCSTRTRPSPRWRSSRCPTSASASAPARSWCSRTGRASWTSRRCRRHLDAHRVTKTYWPERLELVAELPRTPSGKIQKFVLRDQAREVHRLQRKAIATMTTDRHRQPPTDDELAALTEEIRAYVADRGRARGRERIEAERAGADGAVARAARPRLPAARGAGGVRRTRDPVHPATCRCWSCSRCRTPRCG